MMNGLRTQGLVRVSQRAEYYDMTNGLPQVEQPHAGKPS
jgi:hypothetical protein